MVAGCAALLRGEDVDSGLIRADLVVSLGGDPARQLLGTGIPDVNRYWLRVWGTRGLLWAWEPAALPELLAADDDDHRRVREMALKVVARHVVDESLDGGGWGDGTTPYPGSGWPPVGQWPGSLRRDWLVVHP